MKFRPCTDQCTEEGTGGRSHSARIICVIARKPSMIIADGSLAVDGRIIYTAEDLRVGLFLYTGSFWGLSVKPGFRESF
jgi:hypothetical protein